MTLYNYDDSIRWYFKGTKFFSRNCVFGQDNDQPVQSGNTQHIQAHDPYTLHMHENELKQMVKITR